MQDEKITDQNNTKKNRTLSLNESEPKLFEDIGAVALEGSGFEDEPSDDEPSDAN